MSYKQRISPRRKKYDYTSWWTYFITINTKHREYFFGEIRKQQIILSPQWNICNECIMQLPIIRKTITLHEYVIMPNHLHLLFHVREGIHPPTHRNGTAKADPYTNQSLWSIIWNLKAMITRQCNQNNLPFARQRSYHDHIVRNKQSFTRISHYIRTNPSNRKQDTFY